MTDENGYRLAFGVFTAIAAAVTLVSALVPVRRAVGPDPREQATPTGKAGNHVGS